LLDVFVAVFIMGIVVFHINREFDSISAENLVELKES
jgi:hydrogenase-4 component E